MGTLPGGQTFDGMREYHALLEKESQRLLRNLVQKMTVTHAFAADEAVSELRTVLRNELAKHVPEPFAARARAYCLYTVVDLETSGLDALRMLASAGWTLERLTSAAAAPFWSIECSGRDLYKSVPCH
jgi:hypothetical protein